MQNKTSSAVRNWINSVPQTAETTSAFPSVFILLQCLQPFRFSSTSSSSPWLVVNSQVTVPRGSSAAGPPSANSPLIPPSQACIESNCSSSYRPLIPTSQACTHYTVKLQLQLQTPHPYLTGMYTVNCSSTSSFLAHSKYVNLTKWKNSHIIRFGQKKIVFLK